MTTLKSWVDAGNRVGCLFSFMQPAHSNSLRTYSMTSLRVPSSREHGAPSSSHCERSCSLVHLLQKHVVEALDVEKGTPHRSSWLPVKVAYHFEHVQAEAICHHMDSCTTSSEGDGVQDHVVESSWACTSRALPFHEIRANEKVGDQVHHTTAPGHQGQAA